MARKRMIDPSIWADEDFGTLSPDGMVMFIGIISNADDEGRLPGNALYLASTVFPYKGLTAKQATLLRDEVLSKMKSAQLYVVDEKEYIQLKNWASYQSIDRPSASKYPQFVEGSTNDRRGLDSNRIEENRIEKKGIEEKKILKEKVTQFLETWNESYKTKYSNVDAISSNYEYWLSVYEQDQILKAVQKSRFDQYWCDKLKPDMFLRKLTPQREAVDRIGQFLNLKIKQDFFIQEYKKIWPEPSDELERKDWLQKRLDYLTFLNS